MLIVIKKNKQRGSALILTISATIFLVIVSYLLISFLTGQRQNKESEILSIQINGLASDVVELGKYLLAYERIIFLKEPLKIDTERKLAIDTFLAQGIGSLDPADLFLSNACGGYDIQAVEIGDLKVNGERVMCPHYLRSPLFDGPMLDSMLFRMWKEERDAQVLTVKLGTVVTEKGAKKDRVFELDTDGSYLIEISLISALLNPKSTRLQLGLDQNFISKLKELDSEIKLKYNFYTENSGFRSISSERFVKITAEIKYKNFFDTRSITAAESFVFQSSTIKDFAIFIAYPETKDGIPTKKFSESISLGGQESQVYGRVFFDGDIDIPIQNLPVFHEVVIITGKLTNQTITDIPVKRSLMQEKFKKGIVVQFPTDRLIKEGNCIGSYNVINQSQIYCNKPAQPNLKFTIDDYILNLNNMCSEFNVNVIANGSYSYGVSNAIPPIVTEMCAPSSPGKLFISGGVNNIDIYGSHAFVLSPVKKIVSHGKTNIYGTIFGGHISFKEESHIYSISNLRVGLPGIADSNMLGEISTESSSILSGVGVPIMNMPLFKSSNLGR